MRRVILDANFMLLPLERKVDVYSKLEDFLDDRVGLFAPKAVFDELRGMAGRGNKEARVAKACLQLAQMRGVGEIASMNKKPDDAIMEIAQKTDVVCTVDAALAARLKGKGVRTVAVKANGNLASR
ncbi:hypothetical protein HY995_00575 [Candidatus Micrarchaeota archaeon]|nr:hypothetical protein [Candidatus Micrarchaeota archaeon]MBI5176561.1 hypothetical protein [Candidatus Micrarchaeota archaeon]